MGIVIEIDNQYVTVKFQDGSIRKYLKENFVNKPEINDIVEMNEDGIFIKRNLKKSNKKIILRLIISGILIIAIGTFYVSTAVNVGKSIKDCIYDCPD